MLTQVGKYEIVEKVGVGGFGTVYKGRDPFIKRLVAIKTCQSDDEEMKKRFFREAEFAGNLHHPNITTIYDFGVTEDGTPYIVQEFLTGEDLDRFIKRKVPLSLNRKVRILLDVCEGLGYAHAAGIIHRDIKPANIRILNDGTVKIMDFGIAKSMVSPSTLTQTGITLGTASYLAPEQIRGETLDARTDLFSLGVVSYELFAGQKPFGGDHISTVLYKIMNETPPSPAELDPQIPPALERVVFRALEKDRANRYATCSEMKSDFAAALKQIADDVPTLPTSPRPVLAADSLREDLEPTRPTPSEGVPGSGSGSAIPGPSSDGATRTASVADVRLHLGRTSEPLITPARERRGALRLFAAAAVVLLAVAGGVFYTLRSRVPKAPASVEPAPTPTAVPVSPPTPVPAPTAAAPATPSAPEPGSVAEAAPLFVTITFESNANALLSVDGKTHRGLPAPVRVSLKAGRYTAVFEVPGYMKKSETFEVRPGGSSSVRVNFPPWGILDVGSEPSGADVLIDGAVSGKTPLKKPLPIGAHLVELRLGGHESFSGTHEVRELESTRVFANLKKTP
jgi:serine/threonine-protein kinase